MGDPTIYVVDDDQGVLDSLGTLIRGDGFEVQLFTSARDFLDAYDGEAKGCLLVDIQMPGLSGIDLVKVLSEKRVPLTKIMITGFGTVRSAVEAMKLGAFEFIEKPFDDALIIEILKRGLDALEEPLSKFATDAKERFNLLTSREKEVLEQILIGDANKRIGRELGISVRTVEVHRAKIMEKMQADCLSHLIRMGIEIGLGPEHSGNSHAGMAR